MFVGENSPRPVPAVRNLITLDELVSLRFWPPSRGQKRVGMAIREGHHLSKVRARGMEYDDVREYQPGDDIRHLDWRLMARTGEAHTKLFREERERPVFVITDLRPPMHFATQGHFKSVLATYASAMVIWTTLSNGDRVGGQVLTASGESLFKPSNKRQQVMQMIASLARGCQQKGDLIPSSEVLGTLAEKLIEVEQSLKSGTILYLFSDFYDADPVLEQHLLRLSQRCELKIVLITDPLESHLPAGDLYSFTGNGRELKVDANKNQQVRYQAEFQKRLNHLNKLRNMQGVELAHWQSHSHPLFSQQGEGHGF